MRVSQAEMDKSHQRIVDGASRLLRKNGIDTTSVNDVMNKAGLTHGGFYRHFESKESLVSAALEAAFEESIQSIEELYRATGKKEGAKKYFQHYLSEGHLKHPELGCPIAALAMDIGRSTKPIKETFAHGFNRAVAKLAEAGSGTDAENRAEAILRLSQLAGALMIARACDPETATQVIKASLDALRR